MQVALDDYIYCSALLDVLSLDGIMADATHGGTPFDIPALPHCDERLDQEDTARILHDHIDDLPRQQRCVILSVFFDCVTPTETARRLGITGAAVSKLKAKALKRLLEGLSPRRSELLV